MSDQDGDDPETGAGGGGNTPATKLTPRLYHMAPLIHLTIGQ